MSETFQRVRAGQRYDELAGEMVEDWSPDAVSIIDIPNCGFGYGAGNTLEQAARSEIVLRPSVWCDYDADVLERDRMIVRGLTYKVLGKPFPWRNMFTDLEAGLEIMLGDVIG